MRTFYLYRYQIPLNTGLVLRNQQQTQRTGLICCLKEKGKQGWGEIAPLIGFSQESIQQAERQSLSCLERWQKSGEKDLIDLFPSVAFGLSMAFFELEYGEAKPKTFTSVPLCTDGSKTTILQLQQQKTDIAKLKVGRNSPEGDAENVKKLLKALPHLTLRLDANRAWKLENARHFVEMLSSAEKRQILFIEEPCQTAIQSLQFAQEQQIYIAWDETAQTQDFILKPQAWLKAIVIKPSLIGSLEKCLKLIQQANFFNMQCIISSSIESSLGLSQLAYLAEKLTPKTIPGLDTLSLMRYQLIRAIPNSTLPCHTIESPFLHKII